MTAYTNFVEDFPSRCMAVLQMAKQKARLSGKEVTLSLMAASAGLLIPFERLNPDANLPHPSRNVEIFPEHAKRLEDLMTEKFLGSKLHPEKESDWLSGNLKSLITTPEAWGNPDSWPELNEAKVMTKDKTVGSVLKILRNALAHSNIYTKGNPIKLIIFISIYEEKGEIKKAFFVSASPSEFLNFLEKWFKFLEDHKISLTDAKHLL
ncbi:MAG: hypothetical protein NPINA01_27950 [Nitrospinaceae bacterium]|nr:MAG: hypothetical protein NPINA01_27950 [Nitrospinaceae bacterium]